MAGAGAAELAEALDVLDRRPRVAGQVEQRVDQHRAVAGRQDEAVAVRPFRIGGIVLQIFGPQHGRGVGHAHRHAGMAAIGGLDRVHRQGRGWRWRAFGSGRPWAPGGWIRGRTRAGGAAVPLSAAARPRQPWRLAATRQSCYALRHGGPNGPLTPSAGSSGRWRESKRPPAARSPPATRADSDGAASSCATRIRRCASRVEGAIGQIDRLLETGGAADGQYRHRDRRPPLQRRLPRRRGGASPFGRGDGRPARAGRRRGARQPHRNPPAAVRRPAASPTTSRRCAPAPASPIRRRRRPIPRSPRRWSGSPRGWSRWPTALSGAARAPR